MVTLTKIMKELLETADLGGEEISDVPLSTAYALEGRGLITSEWRKPGPQTTTGGDFPRVHRVKLTALGVRTARELQGLPPDP